MSDRNTPAQGACPYVEAGTPAFRRVNLAMFLGGFTTFALLYATQAMLPLLTEAFSVSPAHASLSVSVGTFALALMLIPASLLSDQLGRMALMKYALAGAALIALACAAVTDFTQLLVLRALLGAALAGLPAAAMAYLGEEIAPNAQGRAFGLYISGNVLGGMSGRFFTALISDFGSWRAALVALGVLGLVAAVVFWRQLPPSRHFQPRPVSIGSVIADVRVIMADRRLPWLFACAFLLMGAFVGLYNYLGFRLLAAPFSLAPSIVGAVFLLYFVGTWSSAAAGRLADRLGRHNVLWLAIVVAGAGLLLSLPDQLAAVIGGVALFTFGYFGAHTTASGWVARSAGERRALASALYLCSYYIGSSLIGWLSGMAWASAAWGGLIAMLGTCVAVALAIALRLRHHA